MDHPPKKPSAKKRKRKHGAAALAASFPFATDFGDHFETPQNAYDDVAPALAALCGGSRAGRVLDPYYCDGAAGRRLRALGFANAANPKADFYASEAFRSKAGFDALVTNPPYSGDHKERCLEFALACGKPFCLLLPAYVVEKQYFRRLCAARGAAPFFVGPRRGRYEFAHPLGAGHDESPFASVWVCDSGRGAAATKRVFRSLEYPEGQCVADAAGLQRRGQIRGSKRPNPKQRAKRRKKLAAGGA